MVETTQEADEQRRLMGLDLPFTAESAAIARKQLVDWMRQLDAHVDKRHDARLVVSELVGNSVRHARPLADGTMHVAWNAGPAGLDIAVTDGGGAVHSGEGRCRRLRSRRSWPGHRGNPGLALVGRVESLTHHGARTARAGTGPRLNPFGHHAASALVFVHGKESSAAQPHLQRCSGLARSRGCRRPPPALPLWVRPALQGLPRQHGRSPTGLRCRGSVRGSCK